jgi:mercuric ion transport protein
MIAAICCFTPVLVVGLGVVGLAALTPYLDYVLFPMLGVFLILAFYGWTRRSKKV